jgi:Domain of unknown function (DUF1931)
MSRAARGGGTSEIFADLKRFGDFANHKVYDLLIRGVAAAKANGRHIIAPLDLPITKGLQGHSRLQDN